MMRIRAQRGATLVIALIMLVLLTLFAISALNTSTTNLKVVGNMQARTEAFNAAQQAIDTVISRTAFVETPDDSVVDNKCGGAKNTLCIDKDGKITTDPKKSYHTTLITGAPFDAAKPACITVRPIKSSELVLTLTEDQNCAVGVKQQFGIGGATSGDSLCAESVWQVTAVTTPGGPAAVTGATATVTQGIGIRISTDAMATECVD